MIRKSIIVGIVIGIVIGSAGMYFFVYATNMLGIDGIIPELYRNEETNEKPQNVQIFPILLTNEIKYTVLETSKTDFGINGEQALEGGAFLVIKIEIENFSKEEVIIYGKNWHLKDNEGRIFKPKTFDAKSEGSENIFSIRIPPGFKVVKQIGFEVPSTSKQSMEFYVADQAFESNPILLGKV